MRIESWQRLRRQPTAASEQAWDFAHAIALEFDQLTLVRVGGADEGREKTCQGKTSGDMSFDERAFPRAGRDSPPPPRAFCVTMPYEPS